MFRRYTKIILTGTKVHLRRPTKADEGEFIEMARVSKDYHFPWVYPASDSRSYRGYIDRLSSGLTIGFLVVRNSDRKLVGVVNINDILMGGYCSGSLGYYGNVRMAGIGYMREGLSLAVKQAFLKHHFHRLEANVQPENFRSLRLIDTLGFQKEGFSPKFLNINGVWKDHERFALLKEEWMISRRSSVDDATI
mgnify:CR=1 FL=1|jgi:ribosomal-protein-alanine N-acetyltransferase